MSTHRRIAWAVAAVSALTLVVSAWALAQRLAVYTRDTPRPLHYFLQIDPEKLTEFAGRSVAVTDDLDERGRGSVTLEYGDDRLEIPVGVPPRFPGLPEFEKRHEGWFSLQTFAEGTGVDLDEFRRRIREGELDLRLVAVARYPNPAVRDGPFGISIDADDWGFGEVKRRDWRFLLIEFLPRGGFETQVLQYPESDRAYRRRAAQAEREGLPRPGRPEDRLIEGTWQFEAALTVMPRGTAPQRSFLDGPLSVAGWTLPAAAGASFALLFSIAIAVAPPRTRATEEDAEQTPAP